MKKGRTARLVSGAADKFTDHIIFCIIKKSFGKQPIAIYREVYRRWLLVDRVGGINETLRKR